MRSRFSACAGRLNTKPVGLLLAAVGRSPMRALHLHFMVKADGFRTLVTHIFVRGTSFWAATASSG